MSNLTNLSDKFHQEMLDTYQEAKKECKYNATRFLQMVSEHGGVETARVLMSTDDVAQSGLTELYLCRQLKISVEAKMLLPKYAALFDEKTPYPLPGKGSKTGSLTWTSGS